MDEHDEALRDLALKGKLVGKRILQQTADVVNARHFAIEQRIALKIEKDSPTRARRLFPEHFEK